MKKTLSIASANILFLITMVLVVVVGSTIQTWNLAWGLIATEVLLIALPALIFMRRAHIPIRNGLRLQKIPALTAVLSILLGVALYLVDSSIDGAINQLSGSPASPVQSTLLPKTGLETIVYLIAMVVFAPLCEEILFRGSIQGAYESYKPASFAIVVTALMFAFYHLRLTGFPALLPIAFVLSIVVWRTQSLYAGMLIHFGNNAASALLTILYSTNAQGLPFLSPWYSLAGVLVVIVVLFVIWRLNPPQKPDTLTESHPTPETGFRRSWLAIYWPLIAAWIIYLGVTGVSQAVPLYDRLMPSKDYSVGLPVLSKPVESTYTIQNEGGQAVGMMSCTLAPAGANLQLNCSRSIRAFQLQMGSSYYQDGNHNDHLSVTWDANTMDLINFSLQEEYDTNVNFNASVAGSELTTSDATGTPRIAIDKKSLVEFEWAWQVALLKANSGQAFSVPFAFFMQYDPKTNTSAPVQKMEVLKVYDDEIMKLPKGDVTVRKLTLGSFSAWYAKEDAVAGIPRPVKFDDGMFVYTITN